MAIIFVFKLEFGSCFTSELVQTCSNHRIQAGVPWLMLRCSLKSALSLRNTKSIQRNIRNWHFDAFCTSNSFVQSEVESLCMLHLEEVTQM